MLCVTEIAILLYSLNPKTATSLVYIIAHVDNLPYPISDSRRVLGRHCFPEVYDTCLHIIARDYREGPIAIMDPHMPSILGDFDMDGNTIMGLQWCLSFTCRKSCSGYEEGSITVANGQ